MGERKVNGSILIIAKDNLHLTKMCVKSAMAQVSACDIIVVDNLSSDGTRDWLKTKPVITLHYPYEMSLAECWNKGLQAFWRMGADRVLVLNNDVVIRPDTYTLLDGLALPFVTGVAVDTQDRLGECGDRTIDYVNDSRVPHPHFSAFMLDKVVWDAVGPFDPSYFPAYCEDSDYHVRMHRAGITAYGVDLPFLHLGSATQRNAEPRRRDWIGRMADRNRERFRAKYGCLPGTPEYEELFK